MCSGLWNTILEHTSSKANLKSTKGTLSSPNGNLGCSGAHLETLLIGLHGPSCPTSLFPIQGKTLRPDLLLFVGTKFDLRLYGT